MKNFPGVVSTAAALLMLGTCGCERNSPVGVSGEVSLDGRPLPMGQIVFEPIPGTEGQRRDATIANGKFALPDNQGMLPGQEFQVVIKAFRKTGRMYLNAEATAAAEEMEQYLPENYNAKSTLRVTVSPNPKDNHYKFEVASAGEK